MHLEMGNNTQQIQEKKKVGKVRIMLSHLHTKNDGLR